MEAELSNYNVDVEEAVVPKRNGTFEEQVLWHFGQLQLKLDSLNEKVVSADYAGHGGGKHSARSGPSLFARHSKNTAAYKPSAVGAGLELRKSAKQSMVPMQATQSLLNKEMELVQGIYERTCRERRGVKIWRFLEDPSSSKMATLYCKFIPCFTLFAVACSFAEFLPGIARYAYSRFFLQVSLEALFALELVLRFLSCPSPLIFWLDAYNICDACSALALIMRIAVSQWWANSSAIVMLNCVMPVLRLIKLMRRFEHFQLLISAFRSAAQVLPVLLYTLLLIGLTFSAMIYFLERESEMFPTFFDAIFFTVVTMSTVGYGNQVPETVLGTIIVSILIIISGLYVAIPIGIVGNTFAGVWNDRGRLLILHRMRNCFIRAGFSFADLQELFVMFDRDNDGALNIGEFSTMVEVINIGVKPEWIAGVFETFDDDGGGAIECDEFLRGLFPRAHQLANRMSLNSAISKTASENANLPVDEHPRSSGTLGTSEEVECELSHSTGCKEFNNQTSNNAGSLDVCATFDNPLQGHLQDLPCQGHQHAPSFDDSCIQSAMHHDAEDLFEAALPETNERILLPFVNPAPIRRSS